jgi:predicted DNA-binding transcriptional regulator AlpA
MARSKRSETLAESEGAATVATADDRVLRARDVQRLTGLSRSTLWRMERAGAFPARRQLSARAVGWIAREIEGWLRSRAQAVTARPTSNG